MSAVAIITARGGSKRIPGKNIKPFLDKPIIEYSIKAALDAACFDEVMVSTDDAEIAEISKSLGANVPFMRSEKNSDDYSTTSEVLLEVISEYQSSGRDFTYGCCIYPTAPFITTEKLMKGFTMLKESKADSVVPIVEFSYPILRSFKLEGGLISMNWPEHLNTRSQDLPPAFHDCGQFYFFKVASFMEHSNLLTENTLGMIMPPMEVQDIDTIEDWEVAEWKYKMMIREK